MGKKTASFLIIIAAVFWSLGGVWIKMVQGSPLGISGCRSLIASIIIWAYLWKPKFTFSLVQVLSAIAYSATVILFVASTKITTATNAILLQYTAPVYVAFLSVWLLKETIGRRDWISIVMVLIGMGIFFIGKLSLGTLIGNILAILSGITFALFIVLMRKQKDVSGLESILMGNILTAILCFPFILNSDIWLNAQNWKWLILLGVIQLGIPYILYAYAIKQVTALEGALFPMLEPILNPIWVMLFIGELPSVWALGGGSIVIIGVVIRYIDKKKFKAFYA